MLNASAPRLVSLDVFRGLTVALMILVNNPGHWGHIFPPLRHALWHGLTPTDLVFPFFLFIVGVAMSLGFARRLEQGASSGALLKKILTRSLIIFLLGLFLNGFGLSPGQWISELRLMGVLQRIALCYLMVSVTVVCVRTIRFRLAVGISWLVLYEAAMRLPIVPGFGAGSFALQDNLVRWVDLALIGQNHMLQTQGLIFDPEGLLSTLPAAFTTLLGFFAGEFLRHHGLKGQVWRPLLPAALVLSGLGWQMSLVEPLNKQLWTPSYSLLTGGLALLCLCLCLWMVDEKQWRRGLRPWLIFGRNPLVAFLGSGILARVLIMIRIPGPEGQTVALKTWLMQSVFDPMASAEKASLLFAMGTVGLWLGLLWLLDRRGWIIKV